MALSGKICIDINDIVDSFDAVEGVVYLNNDYLETEEVSHTNAYAYQSAVTGADIWMCDALPLDKELQPFKEYLCPVPVFTSNFGEPIAYHGSECCD